ncbi:unnamed protein product, partial [Tetraodon nigroviridis]
TSHSEGGEEQSEEASAALPKEESEVLSVSFPEILDFVWEESVPAPTSASASASASASEESEIPSSSGLEDTEGALLETPTFCVSNLLGEDPTKQPSAPVLEPLSSSAVAGHQVRLSHQRNGRWCFVSSDQQSADRDEGVERCLTGSPSSHTSLGDTIAGVQQT